MNLQKCENGHFYDADKYQSCPHCQKMGDDVKTVGRMETPAAAPSNGVPTGAPNITPPPSFVPSDDAKTVGIFQSTLGTGIQPVVGWLVCVRGACAGKSYPLKEGKNFIGRGDDMDVVIQGDRAIARVRHACIIFEPRAGVFYANPGESHELFYLNNNVVLNSELLNSHDLITLGETDLLFIPLCGPDFSWDDYKKKDE